MNILEKLFSRKKEISSENTGMFDPRIVDVLSEENLELLIKQKIIDFGYESFITYSQNNGIEIERNRFKEPKNIYFAIHKQFPECDWYARFDRDQMHIIVPNEYHIILHGRSFNIYKQTGSPWDGAFFFESDKDRDTVILPNTISFDYVKNMIKNVYGEEKTRKLQ